MPHDVESKTQQQQQQQAQQQGVSAPGAAESQADYTPFVPTADTAHHWLTPQAVARVLGGERTIGRRANSWLVWTELVRDGFPFACAERLSEQMNLSASDLAGALAVSPRTLTRRQQAGRLNLDESDRLYRLARVYAHALNVLEDDAVVRDWLREPNRALNGECPVDALDTDIGVKQVDDILDRIEYGVYS